MAWRCQRFTGPRFGRGSSTATKCFPSKKLHINSKPVELADGSVSRSSPSFPIISRSPKGIKDKPLWSRSHRRSFGASRCGPGALRKWAPGGSIFGGARESGRAALGLTGAVASGAARDDEGASYALQILGFYFICAPQKIRSLLGFFLELALLLKET